MPASAQRRYNENRPPSGTEVTIEFLPLVRTTSPDADGSEGSTYRRQIPSATAAISGRLDCYLTARASGYAFHIKSSVGRFASARAAKRRTISANALKQANRKFLHFGFYRSLVAKEKQLTL